MDEFYLFENDTQRGPFALSQLQSMWATGAVTARALCCKAGSDQWTPLGEMLDALGPASPQGTGRPPAPTPRRAAPQPAVAQPAAIGHPQPAEVTLPPSRPRRGDIICPNPRCGYIGRPKKVARGSFLIGVILCFFFLLPGLIYFAVMSGYNYVCPRCGVHIREGAHM